MKALSIKQPWASLIAHGIKDIENRTWKTKFRGRIYIHACVKSACKMKDILNSEQYLDVLSSGWQQSTYKPISAIIGEVDIVNCVINHPSIWADKTEMPTLGDVLEDNHHFGKPIRPKKIYNWVLANPVLYDEPILNVKGKLSLWDYEIVK